jgi:Ethanolamine utilization protein EutJ (predicted chaperonin)
MAKSLFAGIDLHSNNLMIGIVDQDGKRLKHQKLDCDLQQVIRFLKAVEATIQEPGGGIHLQLVLAGGRAARTLLSRRARQPRPD